MNEGKESRLPEHLESSYTDEEMELLFAQYCAYRSHGYDKQGFSGCYYRTAEKWAKNKPDAQRMLQTAEAKGWQLWERVLRNVALGLPATLPPDRKGEAPTLIDPANCHIPLLMFIVKAKMPELYGHQANTNINSDVDKEIPMSTPIRIIDPDHANIIELNIGYDPGQKKPDSSPNDSSKNQHVY